MQLENNFTVPVDVDHAWRMLNDPERVAPCMPGATLESVAGDAFTGAVKVKLGPISLTYKGKGEFVERDAAAHRVVINASGRDLRGNGTASAKVTGTLVAAGDATEITVVTDMTITGRPAQFGRGVISDVSDKIMGQFASCLADSLGTRPEPVAERAAEPDVGPAAEPDVGPGPGPARTPAAAPLPAPERPRAPIRGEVDAIDLLDTAGVPILKRLVPVLAGLVAVLVGIVVWRGRAHGDGGPGGEVG